MNAVSQTWVLITAQPWFRKPLILKVWSVDQHLPWEQNLRQQPKPTDQNLYSSKMPSESACMVETEREVLMPNSAPHGHPHFPVLWKGGVELDGS